MEIKKSPKADMDNQKGIALLMGLVAACGIMYIVFQWADEEVTAIEAYVENFEGEDDIQIESTQREQETPPPPEVAPQKQVLEQVIEIVDDDVETGEVNVISEDEGAAVEVVAPIEVQTTEEEDVENQILIVVEKTAEFPGGPEKMYSWLAKNIRYPAICQETGIQGRVVCQFVVNKDGKIVDVQVVRGVDPNLDAEAVRVIQAMPAWKPAKNGGKAVRMRYTLPIRFKL